MSRFQEINGHCGHLTIEIIELHAMPPIREDRKYKSGDNLIFCTQDSEILGVIYSFLILKFHKI